MGEEPASSPFAVPGWSTPGVAARDRRDGPAGRDATGLVGHAASPPVDVGLVGLVVREARPEEHAALGEIVVAAYRALGAHDDDEAYLAIVGDVSDRARSCTILAAEASGRLVGCVTYVPDRLGPFAEIELEGEVGIRMLGVTPDAQGHGVGRALMEACVARARADGRRAVALVSGPSMTAAHRLYARLGFRRVPERDWEPMPGLVLCAFVLDL